MTGAEVGFLLLTSRLGNPERNVLTTAQLRTLAQRVQNAPRQAEDRNLEVRDLTALGYGAAMAERIAALLGEEDLLWHYLHRGAKMGCIPISRASRQYPPRLRKQLGLDAPGCLWAKGDLSLLATPMISLVGSRDLLPENRKFAEAVGRQAALQGFTLISGNARGADRAAQNACLKAGGRVISVVADELSKQPLLERVLYLSEEDFDEPFSAQRALSRNRVIHALGEKTFVAQSSLERGGTWDGTVKNLRNHWSPVFCFDDGSKAAAQLEQMGAEMIQGAQLKDLDGLIPAESSLFHA